MPDDDFLLAAESPGNIPLNNFSIGNCVWTTADINSPFAQNVSARPIIHKHCKRQRSPRSKTFCSSTPQSSQGLLHLVIDKHGYSTFLGQASNCLTCHLDDSRWGPATKISVYLSTTASATLPRMPHPDLRADFWVFSLRQTHRTDCFTASRPQQCSKSPAHLARIENKATST